MWSDGRSSLLDRHVLSKLLTDVLRPSLVGMQEYRATLDGFSVVPPLNISNNGTATFTFKEVNIPSS